MFSPSRPMPAAHRLALCAPFAAALGGIVGCTAKPIDAWQDSLSEYIAKEGHGDPNVLRETPQLRSASALRPAPIKFSKLDVRSFGLPPFVERWDVHGVMLDPAKTDAGQYAFLVGVVKRPYGGSSTLEDMRLAVFHVKRDGAHWRVSEPDGGALQRYLDALAADPDALNLHPTHQVFPAMDDVFSLEVQGDTLVATDARSGATWRVTKGERTAYSR